MFGSDLVRPGLEPKANYNIGLGHTFKFLKKNPIGDEITFAYTHENAGSHGFLHTDFGSHTGALGLMKNFAIPGTKPVSGYTWIQGGITSLTGNASVENRFYDGEALGAIVISMTVTPSGSRRPITRSFPSSGIRRRRLATPAVGKQRSQSRDRQGAVTG
jgi:hypothetical protein